MTILVLTLFLSAIYGGTIHATLVFETPALCEKLKKELVGFSINHTIERDCAPAGTHESTPEESR